MNGDTPQPQSNEAMIRIVVIAIGVDSTVGMIALGYCLITSTQPDATLLTAFVGLTGTLFGYLGGMLSKTTPTQTVQTAQQVSPDKPAIVVTKQPEVAVAAESSIHNLI